MKKLYTIRDVKAGYGCEPGVVAVLDCPNDDVMLRIIKGSCAKGQKPNALNTYPEDKEIWCIGEFDEKTGRITVCDPYLVARCIDYIERGVDDVESKNAE